MHVRNFLKPGSQAMLIPLGVKMTLQYGVEGKLDKVYFGWLERDCVQYGGSNSSTDAPVALFDSVHSCNYITNRINIVDGTTWVWGILYSDTLPKVEGGLPDALTESDLAEFQLYPEHFMFFGITCASTSFVFRGYAQTSQWLKLNRFQVLPARLAPADNQAGWVNAWMHTSDWTFKPMLYMSTCVFDHGTSILADRLLSMRTVQSITKHMDVNGYITFATALTDGSVIYVQPEDCRFYGLKPGTSLILNDETYAIQWSSTTGTELDVNWNFCEACGAPMRSDGHVVCSNPYCYTTMYGDVCHFLSTLGLPEISYEAYRDNNLQYPISSFSDILDFPEYAQLSTNVTLSTILQSLLPVRIVPCADDISEFVRQCNAAKATVRYYLSHPQQLISQFGSKYATMVNYLEGCGYTFLSDFDNLAENHPIVHILAVSDIQERAPIFRNAHIAITGKFLHGGHDDVANIIKSYGATVSEIWADSLACVVVGDCMEDNNGMLLRNASMFNVPIYTESAFFAAYEIDKDLQSEI